MNNLIAWATDKWLTQSPTTGEGFIIWYYVARYDRLEELHLNLRFYESISPLGPRFSKPKGDLEYRIRALGPKDQLSYELYEKEENGLKSIRSFSWDGDLILFLEASQR
jgi:hypothetical protein